MYVENRVQRIKKSTLPEQWKHLPSQNNFADLVFRPLLAHNLNDVPLTAFGPQNVLDKVDLLTNNSYPLVSPVEDKELRPAQDPCIIIRVYQQILQV